MPRARPSTHVPDDTSVWAETAVINTDHSAWAKMSQHLACLLALGRSLKAVGPDTVHAVAAGTWRVILLESCQDGRQKSAIHLICRAQSRSAAAAPSSGKLWRRLMDHELRELPSHDR